MASITRQPNGRRTVQFVAADGKRRSIRLGKTTQRTAEAVKIRVEQLNAAVIAGHAPDNETARWLAGLDQVLAKKLARAGLIVDPDRHTATLGPFLDQYIGGRKDVKPGTIEHLRRVEKNLLEFFGTNKPLRDISPGDAERFRLFLVDKPLGKNTACRRCGRAKQFFKFAVRSRLIDDNPFADQKTAVGANRDRDYFISREEAQKVLDACPDAQWRLLFALSRFGGLRCPSEHLALRWQDVDWKRQRITVPSPKTEHHKNHESRMMPMFPELRPYLEAVFDQAEEGTNYVITKYRRKNANLRTELHRIIRRAGLEPWEKVFNNLRATRETELAEIYPSHVVCAWIGNSEKIAAKHYLQVTDDHFSKAVQNPVQQSAETACNGPQADLPASKKAPTLQEVATHCEVLQNSLAPPVGLEPTTQRLTAACSTN